MRTPVPRPLRPLLAAGLLVLFLPAAASGQATRTWVSGVGDDVNPCSRTAPCKTFAGAISKTAEGGEINALDPGGFGAVTITKAITIDTRNTQGGVLNQLSNGIVVNAGPDDDVVLKGLDILGSSSGSPPTTCIEKNAGLAGVRIQRAASVRIEDTTIRQQRTAGIQFVPTAPAPGDPVPSLLVNRVDIQGSCGPGVQVKPTAPGTADVTVRDTTITDTAAGVQIDEGGASWLSGSTIFDNVLGLQTVGTGRIASYVGTNQVHGNDTDGTPTQELGAPPAVTVTQPAPPPTTVTVTTTTPAPTVPASPSAAFCTVPKVTGLTLAVATTRLARGNCARGTVTRRTASARRRGRVLGQGTSAGTQAAKGRRIALVVGR